MADSEADAIDYVKPLLSYVPSNNMDGTTVLPEIAEALFPTVSDAERTGDPYKLFAGRYENSAFP